MFFTIFLPSARYFRVASGPGISGNLEKSGNSVALENVREKLGNFEKFEKSGNFSAKLGKVREFYLCETNIAEVFSKFIQVVNKN